MNEFHQAVVASTNSPVHGSKSYVFPHPKPAPPGTPVVITLVDGSTVSVRADGKDQMSVAWSYERNEGAHPPLVRSIMHGTDGMRWEQ